jgi:MFS family permease
LSERHVSKHDAYAAFRFTNFRLYVLGSLLVRLGTGAQSVALGWEIYDLTGDALALGLTGLMQAVPMIALTLPAGYLADRFSRRLMISLSMLGIGLTSIGLAIASIGRAPVGTMYAILFCNAAFATLCRPAQTALLPMTVPRTVFENAVSWRIGLLQFSAVAGPAIGGFLAAVSVPLVYAINAGAALLFILILMALRLREAEHRSQPATLRTVLHGARFVWRERLLLTTITLDLFAVLLGGASYLLPIFARDVLAVGERGLGWLQAAPAIGSFCMAVLLAHLPPMRRAGRSLLLAVAGFGLVTVVFGLSRSFWLSWAMLFCSGACDNVSIVVRHTLQQLITPDEMRGRVSAMTGIFVGSSNQLGGFESGLVARLTSPVIAVVTGGLGTLMVVGVMALLSPRLRRFGSLAEAAAKRRAEGEATRVPVPAG